MRAGTELKGSLYGRRALAARTAGARLALACGRGLVCHSLQIALNYQTSSPVQLLDETFQLVVESSSYEIF